MLTNMGKRGWADPAKHNRYVVRTPLGRLAGLCIHLVLSFFLFSDIHRYIELTDMYGGLFLPFFSTMVAVRNYEIRTSRQTFESMKQEKVPKLLWSYETKI